jgi:hypothetical protein
MTGFGDRAMSRKRIKYSEGQWFAVPLENGGYALGTIARGGYQARGGLGYFFGPKRNEVPGEEVTWNLQPEDAVLIAWFGDIIEGKWPLIPSTRPFRREDWPVPKFGSIDLANPRTGWVVEYAQQATKYTEMMSVTGVPMEDIVGLPNHVLSGAGAIEAKLCRLL